MNEMHDNADQLRDELAAYALGALDREEAMALERHLEGCEPCRDRLEWLAPAIDQLPAAVPQRTPPDTLRESLMATVRAEATAGTERAPVPAQRRASWWDGLRAGLLRPATAMAAVVVLAAGIGIGYLADGGGTESELIPATGAATAAATLERHGDSGTLHVDRLPTLAANQVYEVWVQRDGMMQPASTFVLRGDGSADAAEPGPLDNAEAVLVTAERRPGTAQPTSEPVLEASLE